MMIYTNNQGPKQWAINLIYYFETKIKYKLFSNPSQFIHQKLI